MNVKQITFTALGIFLISIAGCSGAKDSGAEPKPGDEPAKSASNSAPAADPGPSASPAAITMAAFEAAPPVVGEGGPVIGKELPEIEGVDTDGKRFKISDYRGKVVMIDFWGDW